MYAVKGDKKSEVVLVRPRTYRSGCNLYRQLLNMLQVSLIIILRRKEE